MHEESSGGSMPNVATSKAQTISYPAPGARPRRNDDFAVDPHVVVLFGATGDLARRKLIPGLAYLDQSELAPNIRDRRAPRWRTSHRDEFLELAKEAIDDFGTHKLTDEEWERFAETVTYVPQSAGPEALAAAVEEAEEKLGPGRPPAALSVGAAEGRPGGDHHAAGREAGGPVAGRHGEAVRHRPGQRRRTQRLRARDVRRDGRSSASTTSSARRPRRTSWRSGSPTVCSSRSGTATSSTTSRSTSPRHSAWTSGPTSTRAPAPTRTWWSPTCSR